MKNFATSAVMPHLISVGSHIIKLDTGSLTNSFNKAIDTVKESPIVKDTASNIQENVDSTVNGVQEVIQEEIVKQVEEKVEESTNMSSEEIDVMKEKLKNIANKPEENPIKRDLILFENKYIQQRIEKADKLREVWD